MTKSDETLDQAALRRAAEAQLPDRTTTNDLSHDRLRHELEVHQVELEMQNEALRQSHNALEASRDRYVELYDEAPVGYLRLTAQGLIAEINLTGATLLHRERKSVLRRPLTHFVAPDDQDRWMRHFRLLVRGTPQPPVELSLQREDGSVLPARLDCIGYSGLPFADQTAADVEHDISTGVRVAITDLTERKRIEHQLAQNHHQLQVLVFERTADLARARDDAEAADRAQCAMLDNLRGPLNDILGIASRLSQDNDSPQQAGQIDQITAAAQHLLAMIKQVPARAGK